MSQRLLDALRGMVGLVQLVQERYPDFPVDNHRVIEAMSAIREAEATRPEALIPEAMWARFVEHLAKVDPVGDRENPEVPHKSFLGNVERYRQIFLAAQTGVSPQLEPKA